MGEVMEVSWGVLHKLPRSLLCSPVRPGRIANQVIELFSRNFALKKVAFQNGWAEFFASFAFAVTKEFWQHLASASGLAREFMNIARFKLVKKRKVKAEARDAAGSALDVHATKLLVQNFQQRIGALAISGRFVIKNPVRCQPVEQRH